MSLSKTGRRRIRTRMLIAGTISSQPTTTNKYIDDRIMWQAVITARYSIAV